MKNTPQFKSFLVAIFSLCLFAFILYAVFMMGVASNKYILGIYDLEDRVHKLETKPQHIVVDK